MLWYYTGRITIPLVGNAMQRFRLIFLTFAAILFLPFGPYFGEIFIVGYTDKLSYFPGETARVYLNGELNTTLDLPLYDLAGRKIMEKRVTVWNQPSPSKVPWKEGFQYEVSFDFEVPELPSGIYVWKGAKGDGASFVIKSKAAPIVAVYDTNTLSAYNWQGGASFYSPSPPNHGAILSFLRNGIGIHMYSGSFFRWLASEDPFPGQIKTIVDLDLEDYSVFEGAKVLVIAGHNEYWTRKARENVDRFIESGGNALFLSGNTMYWQVRYNENQTQMICYKNGKDPIGQNKFTTTKWDTPFLQYPVIQTTGMSFSHGGYGKKGKWPGYKILKPDSPLLFGTGLKYGEVLELVSHEIDGPKLEGFTEAGVPILHKSYDSYFKKEIIAYTLIRSMNSPF